MTGRTEHRAWIQAVRGGGWEAFCSCRWHYFCATQEHANARAVGHVERMTGHNTPVEVRP